MIVVDSSVWIDHFRDIDSPSVRTLRSRRPRDLLVGDLVLLEILQGARSDAHARAIATHMATFPTQAMCDPAIAVRAAKNFRDLRGHGVTIRKTVDLIIGTFCIERDHQLLHSDRDFDPMVAHLGLRVI